MEKVVYFVAAALLIAAAFVIFRVLARRDYQRKGRLTLGSSLLELFVWSLYMAFPYLFNPPHWVSFWSSAVPAAPMMRRIGVFCIVAGFVAAFGTMFWFGVRRAFGLRVSGLIQRGPYRVTRNPQLLGGSLLVLGTFVLWPSWYAAGWVGLYAVVGHFMVVTEEEHLLRVLGEEYARYCRSVPRYIGMRGRRTAGSSGR